MAIINLDENENDIRKPHDKPADRIDPNREQIPRH